ncbi:hypothetical protein [Deinococcus ruber]|uniref:hypothetical protein n=1 Tax=Deinococcus ruber TaxID=1848197 RepID=UPI00166D6271|nr:hypothetical protein [Deinococcus ruber]
MGASPGPVGVVHHQQDVRFLLEVLEDEAGGLCLLRGPVEADETLQPGRRI